jgi:hypothetical protein
MYIRCDETQGSSIDSFFSSVGQICKISPSNISLILELLPFEGALAIQIGSG